MEPVLPAARIATPRRYLMCPPTEFDVTYSINPWMDPSKPVDRRLAFLQWQRIHDLHVELGHTVDLIDPLPGMPDMVFAANGVVAHAGRFLVARFRYDERTAEAPAYLDWFASHGAEARQAAWTNEGQGDFLPVRGWLLAGTGFRTDPRAHAEAEEYFGCPVISLTLVNDRYYHLDTALSVLDEQSIMYYPDAFSPDSQALLRSLFPDAILATGEDAAAFGLNAVSDGRNVLLPTGAVGLMTQLRERGYEPADVDVSELLRAGGGVKCCTLELTGASELGTGELGADEAAGVLLAAAPGQRDPARAPAGTNPGLTVVVTSVASDSHTWNLVYLQLVLEEAGHRVINLGACVPDELLISECLRVRPDLVVVSTVNGHGFHDGMRLIGRLRACADLAKTPVVIGGKLGIAGPSGRAGRDELRAAGFDAVFEEGVGIPALTSLASELTAGVRA
jgi:N-dimethylarginine dimethylaminohydrolase/methylmalonyl-CoA mutase cobalamin-binding subunit